MTGDTEVSNSAAAYPFLTDGGTIGKRVSEMPPERRAAMFNIVSSDEKLAAMKRFAEDLGSKYESGDLTDLELAMEVRKFANDNEAQFPRPPDWMFRMAEFKNVVYEITSREIRDGCIYATATFRGDDEEGIMPKWPPELDAG